MRDLLAHYRLVIQGKIPDDTESEYDTLISSASSMTSYGTGDIFKQDTSCTDSEEDAAKGTLPSQTRSAVQNNRPRSYFPTDVGPRENIYDRLQNYSSKFEEPLFSTTDRLSTRRSIMTSSSNGSLHEFTETKKSTHSSLVTIFSIWNTTMGSSLLAMAWGISKSGLFLGILINIFIAAICLYTAHLLLSINNKHGITEQNFEVPDLCRLLIGKWAENLAKTFSIIVLTGADIVYWVLMSNFLYNAVYFLYATITKSMDDMLEPSVVCYKEVFMNTSLGPQENYGSVPDSSIFNQVWDLYSTVPLILGIMIFPVLNCKSPTFFTKFNSLGTISVGYLLVFALVKSMNWGVNIQDWLEEFNFKATFFALSGMLSLSYFIHNIIISVMRHNKHQENNGRDLVAAFCLITFTYLFIGVSFYVSFPLTKSCIEDNILNNFSKKDVMSIIARILLLFQIFTVFPLISYMLRCDILNNLSMFFKNENYGKFSYKKVIVINLIIVFICITFACFFPRIGTLIRYTGALSGLVYIFFLPNLLKMASLKKENNLSVLRIIFHVFIIIVGVINLILQFFITE